MSKSKLSNKDNSKKGSQATIDIAILGATGLVGETLLTVLEERAFPIGRLYPLASKQSKGTTVLFHQKPLKVLDAETFDFSKVALAFFAVNNEQAAHYAERATQTGCLVIDNSSQFRYEDDVPLVVPEVNPEAIAGYAQRNLIANPNCSTIQMVVALKPIYDAVGIQRIEVATYQSVSGTGKKALQELAEQTVHWLHGRPIETNIYPKQIAFNVLPHIDAFQENGYTREEMKMVWETQKILNDPDIQVNPTAVRVPVFFGHSEAIHLQTQRPITAVQATTLLRAAPGIIVVDDQDEEDEGGVDYPTPATHLPQGDAVYVGRIRQDLSSNCGLNLWVVADNIRKGAALNAIQIAELWLSDYR